MPSIRAPKSLTSYVSKIKRCKVGRGIERRPSDLRYAFEDFVSSSGSGIAPLLTLQRAPMTDRTSAPPGSDFVVELSARSTRSATPRTLRSIGSLRGPASKHS